MFNYKTFKYILFSILILGILFVIGRIFIFPPVARFAVSKDGTSLFQIKNAKAFEASFGQDKNMPEMVFKLGDSEIKITIPYSNAKWEKTDKGLRAISDGIIFDYSIIKNNKQESIGIKEEITLNELVEKYDSFIFPSFFTNLHPQFVDGIWKFYDNNWQEKFYIPKPFMIDANNDRSEDVNIEISTDGKFIKITPNKQWMEDKSRKYPIIIDPSFVTPETPTTINQMTIETPQPTQTTVSSVKVRTLDNNIIEIGTEKHSPPKPFIKLNKWDGEVSLKVTIPVEVNEQPLNVNNKLKYESINRDGQNKIDVDIYLKQPETITETDSKGKEHTFTINNDGGVEFDTILYEKPATNKVTFGIETQGLEFYYQPALTQQEKDRGNFRPENVIGSYAVYYSGAPGDYTALGGKNYMTGKAFHIYRPKVSDANGNWVWGSLNVNEQTGLMTVTVPQSFLDSAVYPVNIDPALGYTTIGGGLSATIEDYIDMNREKTVAEATTGTSISYYLQVTTAQKNVKCNLYDDGGTDDLTPSLITNGATEQNSASVSSAWTTLNFTTPPTLSGSTYYRPACWVATGSGNAYLYYDSISSANSYEQNLTYGAWPDPTGTLLHYNSMVSLYMTYAATGGSTSTVTIYPTDDAVVSGTWLNESGTAVTRWSRVDEVSANDADYYYDGDASGTRYILHTYPVTANVPAGATDISVKANWRTAHASGTSPLMLALVAQDGTTSATADSHVPGTSIAGRTYTWVTNPLSGKAWTVNDVNGVGTLALKYFGVETVLSAGDYPAVTWLNLEITYTLSATPYELKHTVTPAGQGGDFNTLEDAITHIASAHSDLVTAGVYATIEISGDWTGVTDTTQVDIDGINTDATHYIYIYTTGSARHAGVWSTSAYRLIVNADSNMYVRVNAVRIDGLQFNETNPDYDHYYIGTVGLSASDELRVSNTIFKGHGNASYQDVILIAVSGALPTIKMWNILGYNFGAKNNSYWDFVDSTNNITIYSSTFIWDAGTDAGIRREDGTVVLKNVYSGGSGGDNYMGTITKTTCASSDATGTAAALRGILVSTTADSTHAGFTNVTGGSEDFHIKVGSPLIDVGTNTSGDASPLNFTTDIDGVTRSGTWDIGADEYAVVEIPAETSTGGQLKNSHGVIKLKHGVIKIK